MIGIQGQDIGGAKQVYSRDSHLAERNVTSKFRRARGVTGSGGNADACQRVFRFPVVHGHGAH